MQKEQTSKHIYNYHDPEGEAGDDRVLNRHGGEFDLPEETRKCLSERTERVLTYGGEDCRAGKLPKILWLMPELLNIAHRLVVLMVAIVIRQKWSLYAHGLICFHNHTPTAVSATTTAMALYLIRNNSRIRVFD